MTRTCSDCAAPISSQSRHGRCRRCAIHKLNADPDYCARRTEGVRRRFADPIYRAKQTRQIRAGNRQAWRDPDKRERMLSTLAANRAKAWTEEARALWTAGRKEAGRKRHETVMAWCPPEYRAEYRHLRLTKKMRAADAKAFILAKLTPFEKQMQAVRNGARLVDRPNLRRADPDRTLGGVVGVIA